MTPEKKAQVEGIRYELEGFLPCGDPDGCDECIANTRGVFLLSLLDEQEKEIERLRAEVDGGHRVIQEMSVDIAKHISPWRDRP